MATRREENALAGCDNEGGIIEPEAHCPAQEDDELEVLLYTRAAGAASAIACATEEARADAPDVLRGGADDGGCNWRHRCKTENVRVGREVNRDIIFSGARRFAAQGRMIPRGRWLHGESRWQAIQVCFSAVAAWP